MINLRKQSRNSESLSNFPKIIKPIIGSPDSNLGLSVSAAWAPPCTSSSLAEAFMSQVSDPCLEKGGCDVPRVTQFLKKEYR